MVTKQERGIPWIRPGWFEQASAWICAGLKGHGIDGSGAIEQSHSYPWSTVLRVPTCQGDLYFKAVSPADPHEPALLEALAHWRPDRVAEVLALDTERRWMLMRDAGRMLRDTIRPTRDGRPWLPVLPVYARLQIDMAGRVPALLALGVPDRRLSVLPTLYESLLADVGVLRIGRPPGLTPDQYRCLLALAPRVRALCAELADYRIPETLNHGDLSDGNVVLRDGWPIFIDWGDSCVSHPFYSLRTVLVSARISLEVGEDAVELQTLRDAYLEAWSRFGSPRDLRRAFGVAGKLASINGALTWHRLVSRLEGRSREEYAVPVPALLREFLDAETITPG